MKDSFKEDLFFRIPENKISFWFTVLVRLLNLSGLNGVSLYSREHLGFRVLSLDILLMFSCSTRTFFSHPTGLPVARRHSVVRPKLTQCTEQLNRVRYVFTRWKCSAWHSSGLHARLHASLFHQSIPLPVPLPLKNFHLNPFESTRSARRTRQKDCLETP